MFLPLNGSHLTPWGSSNIRRINIRVDGVDAEHKARGRHREGGLHVSGVESVRSLG